MKDTDLAWLAGIWDGEGTCSLYGNREKNGSRKIKPRFSMGNTDLGIINRALKIVNMLGVNPYIYNRQPKKKQHKACTYFVINKREDITIVLEAILPYMTGEKKEKAKLVLHFCKSRIKQKTKNNRNDLAKYTPEELDLYEQSRVLHNNPGPILRDYTSDTYE